MGLRANVVCSSVWYKHPLSARQHNFPFKKTEKHSTLVVSVARWGLRIRELADMIMTPWQPGELRWSVMAALELITTFWTFCLRRFEAKTTNSLRLQGSGLSAWESDVKLVWYNICETYSDFRQIWQGNSDTPLPWCTLFLCRTLSKEGRYLLAQISRREMKSFFLLKTSIIPLIQLVSYFWQWLS